MIYAANTGTGLTSRELAVIRVFVVNASQNSRMLEFPESVWNKTGGKIPMPPDGGRTNRECI